MSENTRLQIKRCEEEEEVWVGGWREDLPRGRPGPSLPVRPLPSLSGLHDFKYFALVALSIIYCTEGISFSSLKV